MESDLKVTGALPIQTFGVLFFGRIDWGKGSSRADVGVGRGGHGNPFFFEMLNYFLQNSQKNKKHLYSWQVGKQPGHPFLNFLDLSLVLVWSKNKDRGPPLDPSLSSQVLLFQ